MEQPTSANWIVVDNAATWLSVGEESEITSLVRGVVPGAAVVTHAEYRAEIGKLAAALLQLDDETLRDQLLALDHTYPQRGREARRLALELDSASRVIALFLAPSEVTRAELLRQAAIDYGVLQPSSTSDRRECFGLLIQGRPFQDGYDLLWHATPEPKPPEAPAPSPQVLYSLEFANEIRIVLDIGGNALAGALMAKLVDALIRWSRRRRSSPITGDEDKGQRVVAIYGADGQVLATVDVATPEEHAESACLMRRKYELSPGHSAKAVVWKNEPEDER